MPIVFDYPPLFDEIDARFHIGIKGVIFAWGALIYNPQRIDVPPQLIAHESVHGARQGRDIEGWWHRYIDDPVFRLTEEIPAHRAEYRILLGMASNRQQRRAAAKVVAKRMASPLYGHLVTRARALHILKAA